MAPAWMLAITLSGCSTTDAPEEPTAQKGAKAKGKATKAKTKRPPPPQAKAVGAEGPVVGEMAFKVVEDRTEAGLHLTFGTEEEADVLLGRAKGTCALLESVPVGPEGKQQTPLWTVRCGEGEEQADLFILQAGDAISVLRLVPPATEGGEPTYKPVKSIPLVKGAELQRKG